MPYCLSTEEPLPDGVRRVMREQIDRSIAGLTVPPEQFEDGLHDARKCIKRIRAVLRLVRRELGDSIYVQENVAYRDVGRALSSARDSAAVIETWDALIAKCPDAADVAEADAIRAFLEDRRTFHTDRLSSEHATIISAVEAIRAARSRLEYWPLNRDRFGMVKAGVRRIYTRGRRRYNLCQKDPSTRAFHEWRKLVKYLWHQTKLLTPGDDEDWVSKTEALHTLSSALGADHDLAVLWELIDDQPRLLSKSSSKLLGKQVARARKSQQKLALGLGEVLYSAKPREFTGALAKLWT